jgi:hypothetical protein
MAGNMMKAMVKAGLKPSQRFLDKEKEIAEKRAKARAEHEARKLEDQKNRTKA